MTIDEEHMDDGSDVDMVEDAGVADDSSTTDQIRTEPDMMGLVMEMRTSADRLEELLLGGKRVLDHRQLAQLAGLSTSSTRKLWRALGFNRVPQGQVAFTLDDVKGLRRMSTPVRDGLMDDDAMLSIARAVGHTTDRLVVWQMEALVEYLSEERGLTEAEARQAALTEFELLLEPLEEMLVYTWRRNLAGVLGRLSTNVQSGLEIDNRQGWHDESMPLARMVGFSDLVSYTRLSQQMEPRQLADLVQRFQNLAHNVVATGGGRVIKTVGDEVFFAAESPQAGAEIAISLRDQIRADARLPQARIGMSWGRVLSRLGDIFGSTVNLASRLTAIARPGSVCIDGETARVLTAGGDAWRARAREEVSLQGFGEVRLFSLERGTAEPLEFEA